MKDKVIHDMKRRHLLILLLCFLGMMSLMRYTAGQVSMYSGGVGILDLNFGNSAEYIQRTLALLGNNGRQFYLTHFFPVDFMYAISYAAFYACSLSFLLRKAGVKKRAVFCVGKLLPFGGMLFDWLENLCFILVILNYPSKINVLCVISSICTILKFIFVYTSFIGVIILLISHLDNQLIRKRSRQ